MTAACLGPDGTIRRGIVLKLIEAASAAAASEGTDVPPQLLSLSTAFPHPLSDEDLVAVARASINASSVHVSVEVHPTNDAKREIAVAQAVYEAKRRSDKENES